MSIDPRVQRQARLEHLRRQRLQHVPLDDEHVADRAHLTVDPPVVIGAVSTRQPRVQLGQRRHLRHRNQVVAAEPAALAFHPTLLVRTVDAGHAVERVEPVMGTEQHPPVVLRPPTVAAEQHRGDRRLQVVVLDVFRRDAAELGERLDVTLEERFLRLGGAHPVDRAAGETQPHREQVTLRPPGREIDPEFCEVDLGFRARLMGLRDEDLRRWSAGFGVDLRSALWPLPDDRPRTLVPEPRSAAGNTAQSWSPGDVSIPDRDPGDRRVLARTHRRWAVPAGGRSAVPPGADRRGLPVRRVRNKVGNVVITFG